MIGIVIVTAYLLIGTMIAWRHSTMLEEVFEEIMEELPLNQINTLKAFYMIFMIILGPIMMCKGYIIGIRKRLSK